MVRFKREERWARPTLRDTLFGPLKFARANKNFLSLCATPGKRGKRRNLKRQEEAHEHYADYYDFSLRWSVFQIELYNMAPRKKS